MVGEHEESSTTSTQPLVYLEHLEAYMDTMRGYLEWSHFPLQGSISSSSTTLED